MVIANSEVSNELHQDCFTRRRSVEKTVCKAVYCPETIYARLLRGWSLDYAVDLPFIGEAIQ